MAKVSVTSLDGEIISDFPGIKENKISFIDKETHGTDPITKLGALRDGDKLLITAPNVSVVHIQND